MLKLFSRKNNATVNAEATEEFKIDVDVVEVEHNKVVHTETKTEEQLCNESDLHILNRLNDEIKDMKLADDVPSVVINKLRGIQSAVDNLRYLMTSKTRPLSEENMVYAQEIREAFNKEVRALLINTRIKILNGSMMLKGEDLYKYIDDISWYTCPLRSNSTLILMAELQKLV